MKEDISDSPVHENAKVTYTIFPKDATAKEIADFLRTAAAERERELNDGVLPPPPSNSPSDEH